MLASKIKVAILGLLAVMLMGSLMTASASAEEAGPFWHHRPIGGKGEGEKVESKAPENFKGKGGEQRFRTKIVGTEVEFKSESVQAKGALFNGPLRGQMKTDIVYKQPTLIKPSLPNCTVTIGEKNIIQAKGYLTWKWTGEKKQLEEKPVKEQTVDGIFSTIEPPQQKPPTEIVSLTHDGTFTTVALASNCGVLVGKFPVTGSYGAIPNRKLEEFSKNLSIRVIEPPQGKETFFQHYYDGTGMQGAEVGLMFGGNPAAYFLGQTELESTQQEVAVFE